MPEILKTSPNNLSLVKNLPESSEPSNNETPTETAEEFFGAAQDQDQSEAEGQEISDIDNSELDNTAEKREQYLDKGARELAVGILDKFIEEDNVNFIPAGEEATEEQPPEENGGYYKNHDLSTTQSEVKINVFHAKPSGDEEVFVVSAAKGEDANEVVAFYPSKDFDMADYDLEQLRDLIKNDPETLEFEGASISSPGEHGEYSYGPISIDEVEDSDIKTFIDKAKTMAEEDFGVEVQ